MIVSWRILLFIFVASHQARSVLTNTEPQASGSLIQNVKELLADPNDANLLEEKQSKRSDNLYTTLRPYRKELANLVQLCDITKVHPKQLDVDSTKKAQEELSNLLNFMIILEKIRKPRTLSYNELIRGLNLHPHLEGGFYREFYSTDEKTIMFYLVPPGGTSSLYRLKETNETWTWLAGAPLLIPLIDSSGKWTGVNQVNRDTKSSLPAGPSNSFGDWSGAYIKGNDYSFLACECKPPFQRNNFKMASTMEVQRIIQANPNMSEIIERLVPQLFATWDTPEKACP